ncbi:alpha-ketoglutarate-dependent dioxygenase AlkB [Chitinophaga sedimenti]|uniref:alpha-ketoglutarate-dependent dioxygenase AlkB family protein n=1 Tax=Chitinophaga sedimenti TaxID=2033606 RepID=UPI002005D862|nr:alpha-ketoglutarate-dependent dioxygenase AlkB [Chitinophaga sedimenti]MCK7557204.1 alpha-ketoglutarate-dependent dioxygenase AlkB [Chitinophaga sedimenti]
MNGITYIESFLLQPDQLFQYLAAHANWDDRMAARKTASYGVAYNYSQISYPYRPMPDHLQVLSAQIREAIGFTPNNCLINYYLDGQSKMGFHSDQTDILVEDTGVVIVSLGVTRTLRFRNIVDKNIIVDYELPPGSLIYMTQAVQDEWQHAIPTANVNDGRMSLTFRKIK